VTFEQARLELKTLADRMAVANADAERGHERDAAGDARERSADLCGRGGVPLCRGRVGIVFAGATCGFGHPHAGVANGIGRAGMRRLRALWFRVLRARRTREDFDLELESQRRDACGTMVCARAQPRRSAEAALIRLGGAEQTRQAYREESRLSVVESCCAICVMVSAAGQAPGGDGDCDLGRSGWGLARNATIFSMVSRFVLRPAPVGDPATLLAISTTRKGDRCCNKFPNPVFEDVRNQARSFSSMAAYYELIPASISGDGEPERVWGQGPPPTFST